jgi:2-polyprenyl-6-hydroxyphenyl methylase/3-demethylubiquinone-9 3-methyltransferase
MDNIHAEIGWMSESPSDPAYVLPTIHNIVERLYRARPVTILDVGCGNGHIAESLAGLGHFVTAVDSSPTAISIARTASRRVRFETCSIYDEQLVKIMGKGHVDCVISVEVVEHLYYPKKLFEQSQAVLKDGGYLIITTPYHGYLKNCALSILNGWDRHFSVHWDGGHIKFFSKRSLATMAREAGFSDLRFRGVGRLPALWKSIIMVGRKKR